MKGPRFGPDAASRVTPPTEPRPTSAEPRPTPIFRWLRFDWRSDLYLYFEDSAISATRSNTAHPLGHVRRVDGDRDTERWTGDVYGVAVDEPTRHEAEARATEIAYLDRDSHRAEDAARNRERLEASVATIIYALIERHLPIAQLRPILLESVAHPDSPPTEPEYDGARVMAFDWARRIVCGKWR